MPDIIKDIIELERRRCVAMCKSDMKFLESLLHADLYFCHSNGVIDDRASYLLKMSKGRIVYQSITWADQAVTLLGNGAILTGRMTSMVVVDGVAKRLDNRVMQAWMDIDGEWRLFGFQSTPLLN